MCGHTILGQLNAFKSGHALNNLLLREVFKRTDAWQWVTYEDESKAPIAYQTTSPSMV